MYHLVKGLGTQWHYTYRLGKLQDNEALPTMPQCGYSAENQDWCLSDKRTPRRSVHAPPGTAAPSALLLIFHVTPMRGVFPHKKGLKGGLNLLFKHRTLLIRLHRLQRVPDADGEAAVGIIDILSQPSAP
jgi:hypothetical protein